MSSNTSGSIARGPDDIPSNACALEGPSASSAQRRKVVRVNNLEIFGYPSKPENDGHLRRYSMLFVDPSRIREGRQSVVYGMENSWGERFAVKITRGNSLDEECRCQNRVSDRLGFPRLFARGEVDGHDALVMEWLEGDTLESVRSRFSLDKNMRMSPLAVARIGRDMCRVLESLDTEDAGVIHRDISTTNIFFRTSALSLPEQISEGTFDVYLLDFGSALDIKPSSESGLQKVVHTSNASQDASASKVVATPAFAAPELLSKEHSCEDIASIGSAVDVYALGSVLYLMLTGYTPFDILEGDERFVIEQARDAKLHGSPKAMHCAHGVTSDLAAILSAEPEVAVSVGHAISDYSTPLTPQDVCIALNAVDEQLCQILLSCLKVTPSMRPSFEELEDMFAAFCDNYKENIGRALRDEPLISVYPKHGLRALPHSAQTVVKRVGQGICVAVGASVLLSSSMLAAGLPFAFGSGTAVYYSGNISAISMAAILAAPSVIGYLVRGRRISTAKGLVKGSLGLIAAWALLFIASLFVVIDSQHASYFLFTTCLSLFATSWCPMVLDYVFPSFNRKRSKGLPKGTWQDVFGLPESYGGSNGLPESCSDSKLPEAKMTDLRYEGEDDGTEQANAML